MGQGGLTYRGDVKASHLSIQLVVAHLLQLALPHLQVGNVALPSGYQQLHTPHSPVPPLLPSTVPDALVTVMQKAHQNVITNKCEAAQSALQFESSML